MFIYYSFLVKELIEITDLYWPNYDCTISYEEASLRVNKVCNCKYTFLIILFHFCTRDFLF